MNYPLISEYIEAIRAAEDNLASLTYLRPVMDEDGNPIMSSGNFAVVFKMQDIRNGDYNALKCFTREQEGRAEAYKQISSALSRVESKYLVKIRYLDYELYVDSSNSDETEFPILLMDWVDGITLDKYLQQYLGNSFELHDICVEFAEMSKWLVSQSFAHGDLKPDNIIVRPNGEIVLIDYDGMYTPSMSGQKAREIGSNNYRHPHRGLEAFNNQIDDFALAAISLSLKAISISYGILDEVDGCESFIFNENDYYDLRNSVTFQLIEDLKYKDPSISPYISTFLLAHSQIKLKAENFNFGDVRVSTLLTRGRGDDDVIYYSFSRSNEPIDEYGIIYSHDGQLVLHFDYSVCEETDIHIKEGVICICEGAFSSYKKNRKLNIHLPRSLRFFTKESLDYKYNRLSWDSPWFVYKDGFVYTKDFSGCVMQHLNNAQLDSRVKIIERKCFQYMDVRDINLPEEIQKVKEYAFADATLQENLSIPKCVTSLGKRAFSNCKGLKALFFNGSINYLGEWCFSFNKELENVIFPENCDIKEISTKAFHYCSNLKQIAFPTRLKRISNGAFQWCVSLYEIEFPQSLVSIGDEAFNMIGGQFPNEDEKQHSSLSRISFPPSINSIGKSAFCGCNSLKEIIILSENIKISNASFSECDSLVSFCAENLVEIPESCFKGCFNLVYVKCPDIYHIKKFAFKGCSSLEYIMPESVRSVDFGAFNGVKGIIPNNNYLYEEGVLYDKEKTVMLSFNNDIEKFSIPNGVYTTSHEAFTFTPDYISLPDSISDQTILDILTTLHCKYVQMPKGRKVELSEAYKKAKDYNEIRVDAFGTDAVYFDQYGIIYTEDKKKLLKFPMSSKIENYTVLSSCIEIGSNAFQGDEDYEPEGGYMCYYGNRLTNLILPEGLSIIGESALNGCRELTHLRLPLSLKHISDFAFYGCVKMESLTIPSNLKYLGKHSLPQNLRQIKSESPLYKEYEGCLVGPKNELLWISPSISKLSLPSEIIYKGHKCVSYDNCIISKTGVLLWVIPNIKDFEIPSGVKEIADFAFNGNHAIETLYIPEGVFRIGDLGYHEKLKSIWLPSTITNIGNIRTHHGYKGKYSYLYHPKEIHVPKGMKRHFIDLLPGVNEESYSTLIDDYK